MRIGADAPKDPDYKMDAMKIIADLIEGDDGYDIFRGQPRAGLLLLPKALRGDFQQGKHLEALARFRRECPAFGLVVNNSLEDVAIAQHYGLATYLLDWTTNPLVALLFASEHEKDDQENPATGEVFKLNKPTPLTDEEIKDDNWQHIERLRLYNPRLVDARFVRQKGLFTIQGLNSKPVPELLESSNELVQHQVPAEVKAPLREILYRMGIDRSTLFPGPDGLCDRINWETKNRVVSNFPPVTGARVIYLEAHAVAKSAVSGDLNVGRQPEPG